MKLLPKWGLYLILLVFAAGGILLINLKAVQTVSDQVSVYVANKEIIMDMPIQASDFRKENYSANKIPKDALLTDKQLKSISGKLTRVTVLEGQVLVSRMITGSESIRDIVKSTSPNYVSISIPLDASDMPLTALHNGDVISIIGVTKVPSVKGGEVIESKYVVENILVIQTVDDSRSGTAKILVLVPRAAGPEVVKYLRAGKYNIAIDPHVFDPANFKFKVNGVEFSELSSVPSGQSTSQETPETTSK